ncbi:putative Membrane protein-like [Syntrophobacter sp. SbD2]|nr:putative Membrane protein-like [Syntrophobacter sp. SbD2]
MTKAVKILVWGACGAWTLLVLLAAAAVLLPHVIDTDALGRNIAAEIEARHHLHSERIKISFLPFPRMVMHGVKMTIPETLKASAESVILHPKILPLFVGKFTPDEIELLNPKITVILPDQVPESSAESSAKRLLSLKDRISQFQATLLAAMPGATVDARNGRLDLCCGQNRTFFFEEIDLKTSVHAQRVDFELTSGKSDLWQALEFSGWVDLGTLKSSAELKLAGGNPRDLMRYLNKSASDRIGDSRINLTLTLANNGSGTARADFTASIPQFTLSGGPQSTVMSNGALSGALALDTDSIDFSIAHLRFDYPRLNLSARYAERYSDQSVTLDIDGQETDVTTVKSIMLAVDKENKITQRIFEIIREGEVPRIIFSARANQASGLEKLENFTIEGSILKGVVFAPKADLLVSNVSGNVLVKDGILNATHVSGQTAGSSTSGGELRIGLPRDDFLFHLDLPITADLSELPDVLKRVVKNQAFKQELAQIGDVAGKAQGRLVLGEDMRALDARVESGPFRLSARYGRLPEPVDLQGASFLLEGKKVSATSLAAKSGSSSLERVDLSYEWGESRVLGINSEGTSVVSMDLLGQPLRAHEYWKNFLDAAPKGLLKINSFRFIGPPADRSKWVCNASGIVEDVVFQNKLLGGTLTLKTGAFDIDRDQLAFREINTVVADSSLSISGKITGFLDHPQKVVLQLSGQLGPEGNKVAASLAGFPPSLRAVSNLNLHNARLTWETGPKTAFNGEMLLSAGPSITISLVETPKELSIENLIIKDEDSDATISMHSGQNQLEIKFSGTLSNKTADLLLVDNKLLTGPIQGKFSTHLYLDSPEKSSAKGVVSISGFQPPVNFPVPARIENATIEADGNKLNVKSAIISWNGSRLSLIGSVTVAGDSYVVDMNAFADSLDLESILKSRECTPKEMGNNAQPGAKSPKKAWEAPVKGTIRVRSEHLSYGKISWDPANADVVLNPGSIDVQLNHANLCGISTPGSIRITPEGQNISLSLSAKDQDLEAATTCLFNKQHILSGSYTLTGNLAASGCDDNLLDSLEGDVEIKAKDGRIYSFDTLGKVISLLSISEIYRGVVPDLIGQGCGYKSIEAKGKIKNGTLVLSDSVVNGPCVKMVFRGKIDLSKQKVDVIALVAPIRTVERVVDATPLMGKVLDEAFVTLPVHISGNLDDPAVVLLSPSAVGEELFGVMKRVFKLPLIIFQPLVENGAANNTDGSKQGN